MGLLDKMMSTSTAGRYQGADFEYESIPDEEIENILKVFKKLLVRGEIFDEFTYGSQSKLWLRDASQDVTFYRLGCRDKEVMGEPFEDYYYHLKLQDELWFVSCRKDYSEIQTGKVSKFEVEYIPEKIGRTSGRQADARNFAFMAMQEFESDDKLGEYLSGLREVLGEDSVEDLIRLKASWYEMLMEDDVNKNFQQNNIKTNIRIKEKLLYNDNPTCRIVAMSDNDINELFGNARDELKSELIFEPKICALTSSGIACAIAFGENDNVEFVGIEGSTAYVRYYVFSDSSSVGVISAMEIHEKKAVIINEVKLFDAFEMPRQYIIKNIEKAMQELVGVHYRGYTVSCVNDMKFYRENEL